IRAALATTTSPAPRTAHAKKIVEDIGERRREVCTKACGTSPHALLKCCMPKAIISGTLVAVLEHIVGFVKLLEPMLAVLVARIAIRMMLHRELAEGRFDLSVFGRTRHPEHFVIVALCHPLAHPKRKPRPEDCNR